MSIWKATSCKVHKPKYKYYSAVKYASLICHGNRCLMCTLSLAPFCERYRNFFLGLTLSITPLCPYFHKNLGHVEVCPAITWLYIMSNLKPHIWLESNQEVLSYSNQISITWAEVFKGNLWNLLRLFKERKRVKTLSKRNNEKGVNSFLNISV